MAPTKGRSKRGVTIESQTRQQSKSSPHFLSNYESLNQLSNVCNKSAEDFLKILNKEFNKLSEIKTINNDLENKIKDYQKRKVMETTAELNVKLNCDDIDDCLTTLKSIESKSKNDCKTLRQTLKEQKRIKTQTEKNVKKVSEELEDRKQELTELNETKSYDNESKELAKLLKLNYKITENRSTVLLLFEDRAKNQRLISSQSKDISKDFWNFLDKKYNF